jgi:large subunit ribosomal protein L10
MTREEKTGAIEDLKQLFQDNAFFYVTDTSTLTVEKVNALRRTFFNNDIQMLVVKNTLAIKAMESFGDDRNFKEIYDAFAGPTALLFTKSANLPARLIEEFRKTNERPLVKAAYIDTAVYKGDDQLEILAKIKSKEEMIGEVIGLLQSPAKNVISALKSSGQIIAGLVKTLEERAA